MAGGLFARLKVWRSKENVRAVDLNGEFNNIINNLKPDQFDDYSTSLAQMQTDVSPGDVGTESLATSLAGEIERIRYVMRRLLGTTYWYSQPATTIQSIKAALDAGLLFPKTRIESGAVDANNQPMFLIPHSTNGVRLAGAVTPFRCYINNALVEVDSNIDLAGFSGPSSFTCLVNDAGLSAQASSKLQGENGTVITVDTNTGSAPSANSYQAWKVVHGGGTEYFYGRFDSTTQISRASRGYLFDSSNLAVPRIGIANNDTITLCRAAYIFFTNASNVQALAVTFNRPTVAFDQPSGASSGDWWFDLNAGLWKKFDGISWADGSGVLIGIGVMDGSTIIGTRSFDFGKGFSALNTSILEKFDSNTIRTRKLGVQINVYGSSYNWVKDHIVWEMAGDLDSGLTEASSTTYYFYITDLGDTVISDVAPYDRRQDLQGYYHPSKPWRCIGSALNDGSSNFGNPISQDNIQTDEIQDQAITQAKLGALNEMVSTSSGTFTAAAPTSYTDITNLSVTGFVCTGRPILISLIPDGDSGGSQVNINNLSDTALSAQIRVVRDPSGSNTDIGSNNLGMNKGGSAGTMALNVPPAALLWRDNPGAGTFDFKVQILSTNDSVAVTHCQLWVREA